MGYGLRYYLFKDDGEIQRISNVMFNSFFKDDVHIPKFANQKLKLASVSLETENRVPTSIIEANGIYVSFDEFGSPRDSIRQYKKLLMNSLPNPLGDPGVIKLAPKIAAKERDKLRWTLGKEDIDVLIRDIWKKKKRKHKKVIDINLNNTAEPQPPEDTQVKDDNNKFFENHKNMDELTEAIAKIEHLLEYAEDSFLEYAFRSVSTHSIPKSKTERERLLWQGVKAALQSERERGKRWKAGDGEWVAAIYLLRWDDWKKQSANSEVVEHILCDDKKSAITAARKLTVQHAMKVDDLSYVEPFVMPLDEWNEVHGTDKNKDDKEDQ